MSFLRLIEILLCNMIGMEILLFQLLRVVKCHLERTEVQNILTNDEFKSDAIITNASETSLLGYIKTNHLQGIALVAYVGAAITIPCTKTGAYQQKPFWFYTESIINLTFRSMEGKNMAMENRGLRIYYVSASDAGVYQCRVGSSLSDVVVLDVLDDEDEYNVVKPNSTLGPYASAPTPITKELVLFSSWSDWSECSRCGGVGRRRRYGPCYIGYGRSNRTTRENDKATSNQETVYQLNYMKGLLRAFPGGIPCRSRLLSEAVQDLPAVTIRNNEIMIGLCKVQCTRDIFIIRTDNGEILEMADNTDGVYSLHQREPEQPPPVSRVIVFVAVGSKVVVRCPGLKGNDASVIIEQGPPRIVWYRIMGRRGSNLTFSSTTFRDVPVNWRLGGDVVSPRDIDSKSNGRIYINARDHVVIAQVQISDSNVYSCWQRENLAGVVKIKVFEDPRHKYGRRLILVALILCLSIAFRLTDNLYMYQRRQYRLT